MFLQNTPLHNFDLSGTYAGFQICEETRRNSEPRIGKDSSLRWRGEFQGKVVYPQLGFSPLLRPTVCARVSPPFPRRHLGRGRAVSERGVAIRVSFSLHSIRWGLSPHRARCSSRDRENSSRFLVGSCHNLVVDVRCSVRFFPI